MLVSVQNCFLVAYVQTGLKGTVHIARCFHVNRPHRNMFSCEPPTSQHVFMWTANITTCFHVNRPHRNMFSCEPPTSQHVFTWTTHIATCFHVNHTHCNMFSREPPTLQHVFTWTTHIATCFHWATHIATCFHWATHIATCFHWATHIATCFHVYHPHCDMFSREPPTLQHVSCEPHTSQHVFMWATHIVTCTLYHILIWTVQTILWHIFTWTTHIATYFRVNYPHFFAWITHVATCFETNHTHCDTSSIKLTTYRTRCNPHLQYTVGHTRKPVTGSYCTSGRCPFPSFPTFPFWASRRVESWRSVGRRAVRLDWQGRTWRRNPSSWSCRHSWSESGDGDRSRWTRVVSGHTKEAWEYSWFTEYLFIAPRIKMIVIILF